MLTGMLWFDNDPRATLSARIEKAMDYYRKKYGRMPELCLVHPSMMEKNQKQLDIGKLTVRPYKPVLPNHFWIGIEEQN
jgi:hypothetical protein